MPFVQFNLIIFLLFFIHYLLRSLSLNQRCVSIGTISSPSLLSCFLCTAHCRCAGLCFNETVSYVGRSFFSWRVLPCRNDHGGESVLCQSVYMCCIPRKDAKTSEKLIHISWSIPSLIYRILYIYIYIYIYIHVYLMRTKSLFRSVYLQVDTRGQS
jgi:hypothetical protein